MEIKGAEKRLDQADSFLTTLKRVLKKHWGIIILILIGFFFYWALTSEDITTNEASPEQATPSSYEEPYVVKELYEIDEYGDTILIDVYSDGYEDRYYLK
jgi:hypothetical protein